MLPGMNDTRQLSPEQREILQLNAGRHLVLAPPGTGKTELLALRVRDALLSGIPPDRILCLTFTVRAAKEMEQRIRETVPRGRALPELGNFHHWCHRFLRSRKLVPGGWQVVDEVLQADLMRETLAALAAESASLARRIGSLRDRAGELPAEALLAHAARIRQRDLHFPDDVLRLPPPGDALGTASPDLLRRIADAYRRRKEALRLLDYDDLLLYAYWFVALKKSIPDRDKCTWVQIDEVQDLNPLQWGLVRALSAPRAHQVFFGDGEQSIFSFLGAATPHLARVAASCDGIHTLSQNYRSRSYLLDLTVRYALKTLHAGWDILPMPGTVAPPAPGALRLAGIPRGTPHEDWLARELRRERDRAASPDALPRTAILVRTNRRADDFETALQAAGLPVCKVSGADWSARPEARDFKAFLRVLAQPDDRMAWARLWRLFAAGGSPALPPGAARDRIAALFAAGLRPADLLASDPPDPGATPLDALRRAVAPGTRTVVFDTETTGLAADRDDIIQLAALELVGGRPGRAFCRYLRTDRDLSATEPIHHISRAFLDAHAVAPADALRDFLAFADGAPLAGHNVNFDHAFLASALDRHGLAPLPPDTPFVDTLDAARRLHPDLKSRRLADLIAEFRLPGANTHNAVDDVDATAHLLRHLAGEADARADARRAFLRGEAGAIVRFRDTFRPLWSAFADHPGRHATFRRAWSAFLDAALAAAAPAAAGDDPAAAREGLDRAAARFLRYADHAWGDDCKTRPFLEIVRRESRFLARFKEVDLLVGDEPIVVSTVHKAKGLEFPRVVVPDAQDGVYPHPFDRDGADRDESARVLYVAMTRARTHLWLLCTGTPSPFLSPVLECFDPGRPDLYARLLGTGRRWLERLHLRAPRPAGDATDPDWLARYYFLAASRAARTLPPGLSALLDDPDPTVRDRARKLRACLTPG